MKIIFKKAVGKQSNKNYNALVVKTGYSEETLTFDSKLIAEILNVTPRQLAAVPVGEYEIGSISDKVDLSAKGVK